MLKFSTVSARNLRSPANPEVAFKKQQKPRGDKHLKLIQRQIEEVQRQIEQLRKRKTEGELSLTLKQSRSAKQLPTITYIDVPVQRIVEREIVQEVEVEIEREVLVEQPVVVHKVVEVRKEVRKEVIVPKIMVRPRDPPKELTVKVVETREVEVEVAQPLDERLVETLQSVSRRQQQLEREHESSKKLLEQLRMELQTLSAL